MDLVPAIPCSLDPDSQRWTCKSHSVHTTEEGGRQASQTAASGHARRGLHRGSGGVQCALVAKLSDEAGAVVVSSMYRYVLKRTFPAAIDGIDDGGWVSVQERRSQIRC